ncbi:carbamate kinase [Chitinimonas sp.]|uniref:carbamate kinase n=1 Tax=Chitinimonas sp. TaxID=1934313 RepID=UPI0035AEA10A
MRIVVALGGNALLQKGEPLDAVTLRRNVATACTAIARLAEGNELIIVHGNGPQVGLLALQNAAYTATEAYPLDVLDAESEGMIGYLIESELSSRLPAERAVATLLTRVEVAADDPAFAAPSKPIGPYYSEAESQTLAAQRGWQFVRNGDSFRRVVPSPLPQRLVDARPVQWLLQQHAVVICAGGGGIPVLADGATRRGVEAVIDKDRCAALLANTLHADLLLIVTGVTGVYRHFNEPQAELLPRLQPGMLDAGQLPAGSMGPKLSAAIDFVRQGGQRAAIGSLDQVLALADGRGGSQLWREDWRD